MTSPRDLGPDNNGHEIVSPFGTEPPLADERWQRPKSRIRLIWAVLLGIVLGAVIAAALLICAHRAEAGSADSTSRSDMERARARSVSRPDRAAPRPDPTRVEEGRKISMSRNADMQEILRAFWLEDLRHEIRSTFSGMCATLERDDDSGHVVRLRVRREGHQRELHVRAAPLQAGGWLYLTQDGLSLGIVDDPRAVILKIQAILRSGRP